MCCLYNYSIIDSDNAMKLNFIHYSDVILKKKTLSSKAILHSLFILPHFPYWLQEIIILILSIDYGEIGYQVLHY